MAESLIKKKSFQFALDIIKLTKALTDMKEFILSKQLLRSATSIGANVEEANAAPTKKDFIYKMSIASKEARETQYWLRLLKESSIITYPLDELIIKSEEIKKILTAIVKTAQNNLSR